MDALKIKIVYNGINIDCAFWSQINILSGYSGTGKTLLLNAIDLYCINSGIKCKLCNHNDMSLLPEQIMDICSGYEVVLLDNADLYLTNDILEGIKHTAKKIIISMKDTSRLNMSGVSEYIVEYRDLRLGIREI